MVLLLDNFDSFTFNLVHYFEVAGAEVHVVRNNAISVDDALALKPELICLSPGPGRPEDAGIMPTLIAAALGKVPIFGVCLGHQALAQHFGAEIAYAPSLMHGKTSEIQHDNCAPFAGLPNPLRVCRYHSLCVERESLPAALEVSAETDDGVVMALRGKDQPALGVQFHPEALLTEHGQALIENVMRWAKDAALLC
ncbi:MAG: aminodeoxychorismate/anthranilate synthase component II [Planctomycetes bacterium]|nr:aminodeoxychorismate/anthranilate synthase component II [Planctomycetota bacterium]